VRPVQLQGIASGLAVQGIGTAVYHFCMDDGSILDVLLANVLYVLGCPMHLLCPRYLAENTGGDDDGFVSHRNLGISTIRGSKLTVPYHKATGLPFVYTAPGISAYRAFLASSASVPLLSLSGGNLTPSQRAKLVLQERFNHVSMTTLSQWIRLGILAVDKSVANCKDPICRACQSGKTAASHLAPGKGVSADQLEAGYPGRMPTTRGLLTSRHYKYVNIWVDHFLHYIYPTFHESKDLKAMLTSKTEFEAFANKHGVSISAIRVDNGVYAAPGISSLL
jgi:hypothetical protein